MQQESSTLKLDCHKRFHRAILFVCTTDFRTNKLQQVTIHSRKPFVRWDGPWIAIANNSINNKQKKRRNNSIKNLSNNNSDGYENVTSKVNSPYFKLYRTYSNSFNSSNVGKFFSSWILKDCIKVQEKKKKVVLLCSSPRQNVKIRHFHISHNAPYLPAKILHNLWFSFLLGFTAVPREIENNAYAKFWRANKVHYGKCGSGVLDALSRCSREATVKKCTKKGDARAKLLFCQSKPIAFFQFSLPSPSSLRKRPYANVIQDNSLPFLTEYSDSFLMSNSLQYFSYR